MPSAGKYEIGLTAPADLDVCNGHTGAVPADSDYELTSGTVYHYHMTDAFPHTIGCYGPVEDEVCASPEGLRSVSVSWKSVGVHLHACRPAARGCVKNSPRVSPTLTREGSGRAERRAART
jgi:hypothetical protein